jgi:hypothetical protein
LPNQLWPTILVKLSQKVYFCKDKFILQGVIYQIMPDSGGKKGFFNFKVRQSGFKETPLKINGGHCSGIF